MLKVTATKSYCNPTRGCRCPVIEILSESRTHEVVAAHIRETEAPGVKLILDYCEADFSDKEKLFSALDIFSKALERYKEELASDIHDLSTKGV